MLRWTLITVVAGFVMAVAGALPSRAGGSDAVADLPCASCWVIGEAHVN